MTDEQLQQLVERDNAARVTVQLIEHLADVLAKVSRADRHPEATGEVKEALERAEWARQHRLERLVPDVHASLARYALLAEAHGAAPLPKKPRRVKHEPEGLPDDILTAYRGLRQRIREAEHITLSPTPVTCAADVTSDSGG